MKGIDVSTFQKSVKWPEVKEAGIEFAILREGYGQGSKDAMFESHYTGAKKAGIPIGAYHYTYSLTVQQAVNEAKACMKNIAGRTLEFPVYYDIETSSIEKLSKKAITDMIIAFCSTIEKEGYFAGVYANTNWLRTKMNLSELEGRFTIWQADYRAKPDNAIKRDILQYSSKGQIKGIAGDVDLDTCTRDFPSTIKRVGLNGYKKPASA
jgi:GH25 family lysozyme M1 (1,4-beta-N-acetylmuramidase)